MWNRFSGKSDSTRDDAPSQASRRKDDEGRSKRSRSGSVVSSNSNKTPWSNGDDQYSKSATKTLSRGDNRDRGLNPKSSSYSSTTHSDYPGTAAASVAAASGNHNDKPYTPADLIRNASLAEQMPKSKSSREGDRERDSRAGGRKNRNSDDKDRDRGLERREKKDKRSKEEDDPDKRSSRSYRSTGGDRGDEKVEASRAPADFPSQVGAPGFSQFPGQNDGASPYSNGDSAAHAMSSHVQDQFPGQFPVQSTAPYRPPIAVGEGGPGLAAEYYADAGESVAEQPGVRTNTPSLIIGAEPHLLPASAVEAPPPEPSASGGVGAAASFYSGEFDDGNGSLASHGQQTSLTYTTAQDRPSGNSHSASAPVIPTLGGAVLGSAAGYLTGSQNLSHAQRPHQASSSVTAQTHYVSSHHQRPPSPTAESSYSNAFRPSKPGKQSTHTSNLPLYAAGAAGLAAAAYEQDHHPSSQHNSSRPQIPTTPMAQRHRDHGPFGALVDFFKDPDGVAQYEEYSELIGVCRTCFAPGSSPRDAPRKHHYRKRRSNEGLGRVDKDSRYHSSENESRRKKEQSWLANGLAGYELAKVGESLFKHKKDFDDTYSVKTGRRSPEGKSHMSQRRNRSKDHIETGTTSDDHVYKLDSRRDSFTGSRTNTIEVRRRSRSRSRSQSLDRKSSTTDIRLRTSIGSAVDSSHSRRQKSASPKGTFVKTKPRKEEPSPERRPKAHKKRKARGFFSLGSASSSSSSIDLREDSRRHRSTKRASNKSRDDKKAEAALLGLGAAAAALALNDSRTGPKRKGVKKLVGVKEARNEDGRDRRNDHRSDEEVWESAPEVDYESADSGLAYGGPRRRGSRDSLSSQSSGTDKWGWRWGSKNRRDSSSRRHASDDGKVSSVFGAAGMSLAGTPTNSLNQYQGASVDSTSSLPLQQVFPIPTSDPTRFDVGREGSNTTSGHPTVVPIQHPQPITPVSTALYSSRPPYEHSYSAPTVAPVLPPLDHVSQSAGMDARFVRTDTEPFNRSVVPQAAAVSSGPKNKRRDSSPARFGAEPVTSSMVPNRRASAKDDTSVVRFDRTEEQEENDRRERRRKRKEDRERREAEERDQIAKEHHSHDKRDRRSESDAGKASSPERSSPSSWAVPAAAAAVAATVGAAAARERSRPEETREERRERRRREREREEQEDEEATRKRERRRTQRDIEQERDTKERTGKEASRATGDTESQAKTAHRSEKSVWQEAGSPKRSVSHEDYGEFFKPLDLSGDQVKTTSANTNSDVDFNRTPAIVTVEPKGFSNPDDQPVFSPADIDEKIDTSNLSFSVPKLRLVEPTPPSSRSSTPTIQPRDVIDAVVEEPTKESSPSAAAGEKDQMHDYTIIPPAEDRQEAADPTIDKSSGPEIVDATDHSERQSLPIDKKQDFEVQVHTNPSADSSSYGEDIEFAATLAASAEDAGFDPSIVIDDPKYRRRDSPPGSADRSMPGGFDDDEDLSSTGKKERKKRDRGTRNRDIKDASNDRDDEALAKDIIKQAENPESQIEKSLIDGFDDEWQDSKRTKSKKSKKGRKDPGVQHEPLESSEPAINDQKPENREVDDLMVEDAPFVESTASISNDFGGSKKSRKKSKRNSDKFADTISNVSSSSTASGSNEPVSKSNGNPKNSIWDRVLNRSAVKVAQENGTRDTKDNGKAEVDAPAKPVEKSIISEEERPDRDAFHENQIAIRSNATSAALGEQSNAKGVVQDSGRITQNLPAKDRVHNYKELSGADNELKQPDVQRSESFLDMRPEPPPPPDSPGIVEEPPDASEASNLPGSLRSLQDTHNEESCEDQTHRLSEDQIQGSFEGHTPDPLSTPTAVPFDFRFSRPRPSIRSARSMSQTRLPTHSSPGRAPRPKPRPRSTEFSSSKEFRPLMLVERHSSHQASAPEETYPSLPSSHTTSRSSSVHDPEERERGDYEMIETNHEHLEAEHVLAGNVDHSVLQSDLLDSQQATPTASSFQHSIRDESPVPIHDSRSSSTNQLDRDTAVTSILAEAALGAVIGATAASAMCETAQKGAPASINLPQEEQDQFQQGLDEMNPSSGTDQFSEDNLAENQMDDQGDKALSEKEIPPQGLLIQQASNDINQNAKVNQIEDSVSRSPREEASLDSKTFLPGIDGEVLNMIEAEQDTAVTPKGDSTLDEEADHMKDFLPQKSKKGKKNKGKAGKSEVSQGYTTAPALEAPAKSENTPTGYVNPEEARQLQEQDAQDAVDSWFSPASPISKDKKKDMKGIFEKPSKIADPSGHSEDTLQDNVEAKDPLKEEFGQDMWSAQGPETNFAVPSSLKPEEDAPQPTTLPGQESILSQLQRRQSKSKGKKAKKGRKSLSQSNDIQSASQTAEVFGSTGGNLDQSSENGALPSEGTTSTGFDEGVMDTGDLERAKTGTFPEIEVSPDSIPLPEDNEIKLLDETPQDVTVNREAETPGSQASLFSNEASHQDQLREEIESLRQHSPHSQDIDLGQNFSHDANAQPLAGEAVASEGPEQSPQDRNLDAESEQERPLNPTVSDGTSYEQVAVPTNQSNEERQAEVKVADAGWAESGNKKKGKKSKKAKTGSAAVAESKVEDGTESLADVASPEEIAGEKPDEFEPVTDEKIYGLASRAIVSEFQDKPRSIVDETADVYSKKKGKKAKKAKESGGFETNAGGDTEQAVPIAPSKWTEGQQLDEPASYPDLNASQAEPEKPQGDWTGFSSKKQAKEAKKGKTDFPDVSLSRGVETKAGPLTPLEEAREGSQPEDSTQMPSVNTAKELSEGNEDQWPSFSTKKIGKKGKKGKNAKSKKPEVENETAKPETLPLKMTEPQNLKPEVGRPNAEEPQAIETDSTKPDIVEQDLARTEAFHGNILTPEDVDPETVEPGVHDSRVVLSETLGPEAVEPEGKERGTTQPHVAKPRGLDPEKIEPESLQQELIQPGVEEPKAIEPEIEQPEDYVPEIAELEIEQPEDVALEKQDPQDGAPETEQSEEIAHGMMEPGRFDHEVDEPQVNERETIVLERKEKSGLVKALLDPIRNVHEADINEESNETAGLHATTTTPQEVTDMIEGGNTRPASENPTAEEVLSRPATTEQHAQQSTTDQEIYESEHLSPEDVTFDQSANDFESQEMEISGQYVSTGDRAHQDSTHNENATPPAKEDETPELQLIDQYGKDNGIPSSLNTHMETYSAAYDVEEIPARQEITGKPDQGLQASADNAVVDENSHGGLLEDAKSLMSETTANYDQGKRKSIDSPIHQSLSADQSPPHGSSIRGLENDEELSERELDERSGKTEKPLLDKAEATEPAQDFAAPELEITMSRDPEIAVTEHSNEERPATYSQNASGLGPENIDIDQEESVRIEELGAHEQSLSTEKLDELDHEDLQGFEASTPLKPGEPLSLLGEGHEDELGILQHSQPVKSKKDKKKGKKAKSLAWEAGSESVFQPEDQPDQEIRRLEDTGRDSSRLFDDKVGDSHAGAVEVRPKSKKERKKAKNTQSLSRESSFMPESDFTQQTDQGSEGRIEAESKERGQGSPVGSTTVDRSTEPLFSNILSEDPNEELPPSVQESITSAPPPVKETSEALEESQDQAKVQSASIHKDAEVGEYPIPNSKQGKKDKKKGKKSRKTTSADTENEDEPKGIDDSKTKEMQDEPRTVPIVAESLDQSEQEPSNKELEPTKAVNSDDNPFVRQDLDKGLDEDTLLVTGDDAAQPMEIGEDGFAAQIKGKKSKKSKKDKLFSLEATTDLPLPGPFSTPDFAVMSTSNRGTAFGDPSHSAEETSSKPDSSDLFPTLEVEPTDPTQASEIQETTTENPEVEQWDVPAKSKKSRNQRKGIPLAQTDSKTLASTSSDPPEVTSDHMETPSSRGPTVGDESIDPHGTHSQTQTPKVELLNPLEQHRYDLNYAQELGRQGVESPRSSRVELPALMGDTEATLPRERGDYVEQDQLEAIPTSVTNESTLSQRSPAGDPRKPWKDETEYPDEFEKHTEILRSPTTTSSSQEVGHESLGKQGRLSNSQVDADNFRQEELEPSPTSTEDLPTPAAEIEMLDAQEQQAYDKEYAKELERQLSPPGEDRSDHRTDRAHTTSNSMTPIDSLIGVPVEQRTSLARPPPLEDIIEEPRSRAGSAQETSDREEAHFRPPKRVRKGKKGKKQQQPIIWEDDTATPPVDLEADPLGDLPARSDVASPSWEIEEGTVPVDFEGPIEHQRTDQTSGTPPADVVDIKSQDKADDYFTVRPSRMAEEDVGQDPDNEEFRRSLSTEPTYSYGERSSRPEIEPIMETIDHSEPPIAENEKTGAESEDYSHQPESGPTPTEEEVKDDFNSATIKRGKKGKKLKKMQPDQVSSASVPASTQLAGQSGGLATEPIPKRSASQERSPGRDLPPETKPIPQEEDALLRDSNSESNKGLQAVAELGAAALAAEGITRRDSKKGGKKEKKGKKTKWADLDKDPSPGSPSMKDETIMDSATNMPLQEQEYQPTDLQAAIPSVIQGPTSLESEVTHHSSQPEGPNYRDSAINVSESPSIPEETPLHRPVRDSGYPETEPSPINGAEQVYENKHVEKSASDSLMRKSDQYLENHNHGYQTPERGRSPNEDQPDLSTQFDPSYDSSISKAEERGRRTGSYDSDDSADSGFDVQRRRRRQAMSGEAREPSPVSSTTKDRSSALFDSSPSTRQDAVEGPHAPDTSTRDDSIRQEPTWSFSRGGLPSSPRSHDELNASQASHPVPDPATYSKLTGQQGKQPESLFGGPVRHDEDIVPESTTPLGSETRGRLPRLKTISEDSQERLSLHGKDKRSISDVGLPEAGVKERRMQPPSATAQSGNDAPKEHPNVHDLGPPNDNELRSIGSERSRSPKSASQHTDMSRASNMAPRYREGEQRAASAASMRSDNSIHAIIRTPDQVRSASGQSYRSSGTPPLRRVDRSVSGDLRAASKLNEAKTRAKSSEAELDSDIHLPSSSTYDPVTDKGKSRADMTDVFEGWGDVRGQSPRSPTRPPSMRKRQSMQILDLETRLDQLVSENRLLLSQKSTAERSLQDQSSDHDQQRHAYEEALQQHKLYLSQKDSELNEMRAVVEEWQSRVDQLREVNEELTSSRALNEEHEQRYRGLEDEHAHLKERHTDLTTGMEALVQHEVATHLEVKNSELQQLRVELEAAKQQVRSLQQQLLTSRESEDFVERDEDYFESQCQSLCQHVQQWVLRFSKFSDMKACYRASEIRDETKLDRMENAILDGTDVDMYLQDRVKRRDVFMAVVMTMIFDYIFTRYLFGMDREQRQKLKNLEKTLQDIGPMSAVCRWRATTLTLLMRREDFARQRATDTEAIVHEIYDTVATFLPPPSHLVTQVQESLRKVINAAADLSIEMRTQRADYQMLPPLQPNYDTNGDLAQKVYFNALTMNERSGATTSNQVLQEQGAVVRMVLFPLVVKNEEDDEQIIVCPAQVLTANSKGKKTVRVMSVQGSTQGGRSEASFGDMNMEGGMI